MRPWCIPKMVGAGVSGTWRSMHGRQPTMAEQNIGNVAWRPRAHSSAPTRTAGEDVAALVELTAGSFDAATGVLAYTARPLPLEHDFGDATGHNKTELGEQGIGGGMGGRRRAGV